MNLLLDTCALIWLASEPARLSPAATAAINACILAHLGGVKRWLITHHDPTHDDAFLETKLNQTRRLLARRGCTIPVAHAYDGLTEYL